MASHQRGWSTTVLRPLPAALALWTMTLKGRLSSLVSIKDADARDNRQVLQSNLPDHIPASNVSGSIEGLSPKPGRQPERGSLSLSRHGTPVCTTSSPSDDDIFLSPRSLDFGRQPRSPPMGSLSMNSLIHGTKGLGLSNLADVSDGSRRAGRGRAATDNRIFPPRTLSVSRPPRSRSRSGQRNKEVASAIEAGVVVVRSRPCADNPIATVLDVEVADTDGSSFSACARAVTANNGGVSAGSFEIEGGVLGSTSLTFVPRFAVTPDVRARQTEAIVAQIEATLGTVAHAAGNHGDEDMRAPTPAAGRLLEHEHSRKGETPRWTVLGVNADGPSTTLTALAVSFRERRGLCEATRIAVAAASRAWRRSNVLFIKVTSAMRAQFFFCVAEPSKGTCKASNAAPAGATLVNDVIEAVNAAFANVASSKVPGAMTLSSMMSFTTAVDDGAVSLREEARGNSTICSVSAPHRFGLLIDTLDAVAALSLLVKCATVERRTDERARHSKGVATFKHICLEVANTDGEPIMGTPTEKSLRWRLRRVVEGTGICGDSRHVAVIETSDSAAAMLGNVDMEGGKPSLAASMTAHIAKANVALTLTSRPSVGAGGSSRPGVVLLASNRSVLLTAESTLAYAAKAFFDVTGLSGHLDHPDAPATKLPPYPASTARDLWVGSPSDAPSVLPSLPE